MLLERDRELALLRRKLDEAARGHGHSVVVAGEAGIGKTALTRAFLAEAATHARVLRGACEDFSIAQPLAPLRDLAREAGWELPGEIASHGDRIAVFSEAIEVLSDPGRPTVAVVEDIHWADEATLDFLKYLARRIDARPILLLMTSRDDEDSGRSQIRRVAGAVSPDTLSRIALGPLSRGAVDALARSASRDGADVYRRAGGNAFFVTELLKGDEERFPLGLQDSILARAEDLDRPARALLDAASIFPRRAESALLSELVPAEPEAIAACASSGLLEDDGAHLAFRHEIARQVVEGAMTPARRRHLNERLFHLLAAQGETPHARLLHHARAARLDAEIARLAPLAARESARMGALHESAECFRIALGSAGSAAEEDHALLLQDYAFTCYQIADFEEATAIQKQALDYFLRHGDIAREGDSYRRLSRFAWVAGNGSMARDYSARALQTLANLRGPELAMAHSTAAQLAMLDLDDATAERHATEALILAEEFERPDIRAHALNNLAMACLRVQPDRARDLMRESLEMSMSLRNSDDVARAYINWSFLEMYLLNWDRSIRIALDGIAYCEANELDSPMAYIHGGIAWSQLHKGDLAKAEEHARLAFRKNEALSRGSHETFTGAVALLWLAARRGEPEPDEARRYFDDFVSRMDELQRFDVRAQLAAELAWLGQGDRGEAISLLERALERQDEVANLPYALIWLRKLDPGRDLPTSRYLLGPVEKFLSGDWRGSADGFAATGARFLQALALAEGDDAARAEAQSLLREIGAVATLEAVARDARAAGYGSARVPRRATLENPAGLTPKQLDVLKALNQGLSNAEIAERMFISPKTVDHHVSAVLGKLGVASRGEAAAMARREGWI